VTRNHVAILALTLAALTPTFRADEPLDPLDQWPQWRGPLATGAAPRGNPPTEWAEDKNVRWKVALSGDGHSTPIVWGDRVFLTTAIAYGDAVPVDEHDAGHHDEDPGAHDNVPSLRRQQFVVLAVDRRDGAIVWQRTVRDERPHESTHQTGTWASNSALTDGERVYAFFGSRGLYALDFDGKVLWERDFGDMRTYHGHGEGSSPALHGDTLVVNWDHQGDSFIAALDKRTGAERWRTARDEITSWSTPLVVVYGGKTQVVVSATKRVRGYDLATGAELWQVAGLSRNVVASPVAADGLVIAGASYDWEALLAVRLDAARGDVTGTDAVAWTRDRDAPYVPSPVLDGGALCFMKHNQGFLTCLAAKTGEPLFGPRRLPGVYNVFASPVAAAGRIYVLDRTGTAVVVQRDAPYEVMARNRLDDVFSASPAIAGDELFLRGQRHLYCLAEEPGKPASATPGTSGR
jgi:outer membrane protein assembly factor BamB